MAASFSRDPLFEVVLRQLPEQVAAGLRNAGLADAAILESYPCDSYMELVGAGATGGGTWYGRWRPFTTIAALPIPPFFLSSLVSLRLPFLPLPLPVSDTHKSRSVKNTSYRLSLSRKRVARSGN